MSLFYREKKTEDESGHCGENDVFLKWINIDDKKEKKGKTFKMLSFT
jgi:hypothetical protein